MKPRICLLFVVLLALVACTPTPTVTPTISPLETPVAEAPLPVVRYANFRVYDPVYVALEKGFFTQRGVQVEIIGDVLGGPTAIQAVASGSAEAGLSSLPAIVNANAAGLPIVGVSDIQSALPDQPLEYYYVRCDSGIESLADLPGKTFAVNLWRSSFHYTALMALEKEKIAEDSLEWVLLSFDNQIPALANGEVDVIGLMEPYNGYARANYGDEFCLLFDALDVFGPKQFTTHFVNRVWAQYNPEAAEAFVGGIADAAAWIEQNQEEAKGIIAQYTGVEAQFVPEYHFQENAAVIEDDVSFWLNYLVRRGDVTVDWLNPAEIATNRYNPALK
ncbi:MAG: ABC transporter substrate-binding protein [Anaerolineae bacterium]|nr:ABC transporter substrate-binding protein [Anaerolineae bacterium]